MISMMTMSVAGRLPGSGVVVSVGVAAVVVVVGYVY